MVAAASHFGLFPSRVWRPSRDDCCRSRLFPSADGAGRGHRSHLDPKVVAIGIAAVIGGIVVFAAIVTAIVKPTTKPPCPKVVTCLSVGVHRGPDSPDVQEHPVRILLPISLELRFGERERPCGPCRSLGNENGDQHLAASTMDVAGAFNAQRNAENLNFDPVDTTSYLRIVSPQIGFVLGEGGSYTGVDTNFQTWNDAIMAASDDITVSIALADKTVANTAYAIRAQMATLIMDSSRGTRNPRTKGPPVGDARGDDPRLATALVALSMHVRANTPIQRVAPTETIAFDVSLRSSGDAAAIDDWLRAGT